MNTSKRAVLPLVSVVILALLGVLDVGVAQSDRFRECSECPEMIIIPAGQFSMGSEPQEIGHIANERPRHTVSVRSFASAIYPVTKSEYAMFVRDTNRKTEPGCTVWTGLPFDQKGSVRTDNDKNWREPGYTQTSLHPVVCVSWHDAQAYIAWLNAKVRQTNGSRSKYFGNYRLLSEAEWEYATHAGTTTPYYWGMEIDHSKANYGIEHCPPCGPRAEGSDRWEYTSPVGSFPPNQFGLYDMAGNIFQWVEDCWNEDYTGAPTDGGAWVTVDCKFRVGRGGDWFDDPKILRAAFRDYDSPEGRDYFSGFRVAMTLTN